MSKGRYVNVFEVGTTYSLGIEGYLHASIGRFVGVSDQADGRPLYLFEAVEDGGWSFGLVDSDIEDVRTIWTPIGGNR